MGFKGVIQNRIYLYHGNIWCRISSTDFLLPGLEEMLAPTPTPVACFPQLSHSLRLRYAPHAPVPWWKRRRGGA